MAKLLNILKSRGKHLKVAVATPSMGTWHSEFAVSLQNMLTAFNTFRVQNYQTQMLQMISTKGSILPRMRFLAVKDALKMEATHLLWIDSDHDFPRKLLHALLEHDKDVVGVNHVTKRIPAGPTARQKGPDGLGVTVFTNENSPPLEKVWRLGCGTMLVKMDVFRKIGPAVFDIFYNPIIDDYQGEDWTMCEAMENAGYEIWVDHVLSAECGHTGNFRFHHGLVGKPVDQIVAEAQANVGH